MIREQKQRHTSTHKYKTNKQRKDKQKTQKEYVQKHNAMQCNEMIKERDQHQWPYKEIHTKDDLVVL